MAPGSQESASMESEIATCPSCGKPNKLPLDTHGKTVVCGSCKEPLVPGAEAGRRTSAGTPVELTDGNFQSAISQGSHLVDFWAAWCGPCRMIAPVLEEIARDRKDLTVGKLNVDDNPRTASQFKVQGIPLLVFIKDGKETGRVVGAVPKQQIESAIRQYLG